jgi:hypothetical protein
MPYPRPRANPNSLPPLSSVTKSKSNKNQTSPIKDFQTMKTNLHAALGILSLLLIAILGAAFAQTVTVGVNPGNNLVYSYSLLWNSTDPTATVPPEYIELNNTQLIRISIKSVSGSLINMDITKHFRNGTETTQNGNTDVDKQIIDIPYSFLIIRSNANPNEKIYPSGGHATITETVLRTYEKGERETNHYISESTTEDTYEKVEIYFDRTTGVAAEYYNELRETSNSYVTTTKETATLDSSILWEIPEFPAHAILLILIFTSLFIMLYGKKLRAAGTHKGGAVTGYKLK